MPRADWPIVVGGCHRSGTSLVRRMLDSHPHIHCGPEIPFWRDLVGDYIDDRLHHLRFSTATRHLLGHDAALRVLGAAFLEVHARAAAAAGKRRWADKAPENAIHTHGWDALLGDDWFFVNVVRDPVDTIASMREARFPLTLPADLDGLIAHYRRYVTAGTFYALSHADRAWTIRYEDLVADPKRVLSELMGALGENLNLQQLRYNEVAHETGLEDPKVLATAGAHAKSVGRGRALLAPADTSTVCAATVDLIDLVRSAARAGAEPRARRDG